MTRDLTAVRQEVNNLDSSAVVHELELAMNLALYDQVTKSNALSNLTDELPFVYSHILVSKLCQY